MQPITQMHDTQKYSQFVTEIVLPGGHKTVRRCASFSLLALVPIVLLSILLGGCGTNNAEEPQAPLSMRAPQPTFTPTAVTGNASANDAAPKEPIVEVADGATNDNVASSTATGGAVSPDEAAAVTNPATSSFAERIEVEGGGSVVVKIQLLNGRAGPGPDYDLVGIVGQGEFFDITGRNDAGDWWEVCCYLDTPFWVADEFVDVRGGSTGQVARVEPTAVPSTAVPPAAVPPTAVPATVAPTVVPATASAASQPVPTVAQAVEEPAEPEFDFELKPTEQFPETNVVRIFLYVFQNGQALPGFSLKVTKDGTEVAANETSFGPNGGFTWPVESARQRFQNMKVEFPDQSAGGTWTAQLVDGSGNPVGPVATFELAADDEEQEMYIRYEQK